TWSYQPPKSSQVTKIAVEDHAGLLMIALTTEETKFCAGCVGCGGGAGCAAWPGGAKLVFGGWVGRAAGMSGFDCTGGGGLCVFGCRGGGRTPAPPPDFYGRTPPA